MAGSGEERLNLDFVTDRLAVGGSYPERDAERLAREHGIRHVVDVRVEARDDEAVLRRCGVTLLHLPTEDRCAISLDVIDDGVGWVRERLGRGERVFIHCEYGVGRSALLALCVLVAEGDAPLEALARAKSARWQVSPSPEQLQAFQVWCRREQHRAGAAWPIPSFEELAGIAYSHLRRGEVGTGTLRSG
ncbi:protein-tyrosine phosphatase family protein [Anaeromyxobacter paludicola]|uniref:Tyrosine specific protein phosphatases domain-containing protein n=1 Tax=Anaeromyxobacter paludicola TaxID=2918171 RepID=A0ABM7X6P3_9BACT|nr:dual specificity protein phosphatase [Anaeromyxobacter paludicola]BDG07473.1 hypothetical protein AMPC_05860 [Anaeromyxobacter paludicola]